MSSAETRSIRRIRSEVCFWPMRASPQRDRACTTNQVPDTARGRPRKREIERGVLRPGIRHVIDRCDLRVLTIHAVAWFARGQIVELRLLLGYFGAIANGSQNPRPVAQNATRTGHAV